jgi:hypothetical protein
MHDSGQEMHLQFMHDSGQELHLQFVHDSGQELHLQFMHDPGQELHLQLMHDSGQELYLQFMHYPGQKMIRLEPERTIHAQYASQFAVLLHFQQINQSIQSAVFLVFTPCSSQVCRHDGLGEHANLCLWKEETGSTVMLK